MKHTLGDAPIEQKYVDQMRAMAQALDETLNGKAKGEARKTGFCLMVFDLGEGPSRCNYVSNADRADVITLLREQLARFEGQPELKGHA